MQAPYVLEEFVDLWSTLLVPARIELMYSTARVALCRAPMTMRVLQKALNCGVNDADLSVRDAARLIYGALSAGIDTARQMLSGTFSVLPAAEDSSNALQEDLMKEFNSLAVLYGRPGRTFVDRSAHKLLVVPAATDEAEGVLETGAEGDAMEESQEAQLLDLGPGHSGMVDLTGGAGAGGQDLLGALDDGVFVRTSAQPEPGIDALADFGGSSVVPNGGSEAATGTELRGMTGTVGPLTFDPAASISKEMFSAEWARLEAASVGEQLKLGVSGEQVAMLMTQQPSPFSGMHGVLADTHIKVCCLITPFETDNARTVLMLLWDQWGLC